MIQKGSSLCLFPLFVCLFVCLFVSGIPPAHETKRCRNFSSRLAFQIVHFQVDLYLCDNEDVVRELQNIH